jgi:hypothetical protein
MAQVELDYRRAGDGTLRLILSGDWKMGRGIPAPDGVIAEAERPPRPRKVTIEAITPARATHAYRAAITVSRFDGVLGGSVVLQGRWELCMEGGASGQSFLVKEATVSEKVEGADYESLVAAMQRALARFAEAVADSVAATAIVTAP